MSGELRLSSFRYSQTPDDDFVIGSPYTSALKTSKYLVFQVNNAVGYGSNPHIRCEWSPDLSAWRLRFSHDGTQINDFALTNANNVYEGINTFSGPVTFNNDVTFNHTVDIPDSATITVPTRPTSDSSRHIANTQYVNNVINTVTVHNAAETNAADNTTLNATVYPTWVQWSPFDSDGHYPHYVSSTNLYFNPSTGNLTATKFTGSGAGLTSIPANQLTGTFSNVSFNLGTTLVVLNRAATEMGLTGITSITGSVLDLGTPLSTAISVGNDVTTIDGTTLNLGNSKATSINIGTSALTQSINIGNNGGGVTSIFIGGAGDTVTIAGTLSTVNTTNLEVTDKLITLNKGASAGLSDGSGIEVIDGDTPGLIRLADARSAWELKTPTQLGSLQFKPSFANFTTAIISPATDNISITLPNETCILDKVGHTQNVDTIFDSTTLGQNLVKFPNVSSVRFIQINANNTVSSLDAASFRTAIGAGTSSTTGTVTNVGGEGVVSGLSLSGTVTTSGNLTLGGVLEVVPTNFASQTSNTVLVAPNGTNGKPTFRALDQNDIPDIDASKITTGTLDPSVIPAVAEAYKWSEKLNLSMTGDVVWSAEFDGSEGLTPGVSASATVPTGIVTGKLLTGLPAASNTAIVDNDSILSAFAKTQGQINARLNSADIRTITFNNSGSGLSSPSNYNTSSDITVSYNTIGAAPLSHNHTSFTSSLTIDGTVINLGSTSTASDSQLLFYSNGDAIPDSRVFSSGGDSGYYNGSLGIQASNILLGVGNDVEVFFGSYTSGHIYGQDTGRLILKGGTGAGAKDVFIQSGWDNAYIQVDNEVTYVHGLLICDGDMEAFGSISDSRLKKDIKEIDNAISKVQKLKGVTYTFNDAAKTINEFVDTNEEHVGLIAQDLEQVLPQLTPLSPFNKDGSDYRMVKYDKVVALLVQAIKEQQVQIDELKSKLNLN